MRQRIIWFTVIIFIAGLMLGVYWILPRIIGEVTYPLAYEDTIIKYSQERELDPFLVAAVIYAESHYRSTAVSPTGARGLMQLIPSTAQGISRKLGDNDFKVNDLFDPETNIRYGTFHLQGLAGRYNSNIDGMLAGYNGGGGVGDRYIAGQGGIPLETQRYVVIVKNAMQKYRELYPDRLTAVKIGLASPTGAAQSSLANQFISSVVTFLQRQ